MNKFTLMKNINDYDFQLLNKFTNLLMRNGKKITAIKIINNVLHHIKIEKKQNPINIFNIAILNAQPILTIKTKKIRAHSYQIPTEITPTKQKIIALKWLIENAQKRNEKSIVEKLKSEIIDTFEQRGTTIQKKIQLHKLAEANRIYAKFK